MVLAFFIFYFVILQFFNDWQYRRYLDGGDWWVTLKYRVYSLPFKMLEYYLFYTWGAPLLFKKKFAAFFLALLLFIVLLEIDYPLFYWIRDLIIYPHQPEYPIFSWDKNTYLHQSLHFTLINLFAITGFFYFTNMFKEEKIKQQLKEQHFQLELNYLKAQLHPHFFFNTMNNIYSLALYRSEKTAPIVEELSQMMRYIIYEGKKDKVPLQTEIEFLKNFVALEKIRHEDNVSISFTVQGDSDQVLIPPLLFMPLLENSFKHGIDNNKNFWVEVAMLVENNEIIFEIKNSYHCSKVANEPGIGLDNLRKRLALLYPQKHALIVKKGDEQFEANLTLTLL